MTARRCLPPLVALALVVPALSSCGLLGGGSSLDDALEVVPGDAGQVYFVDRAAMAERLDLDDVETGGDEGDLDDYLKTTSDDPVGGTPLSLYLRQMQEAAFSELDVEWWVQARPEEARPIDVYKVADVDFDDLVGELEDAGFDSKESDGRMVLTSPGLSDVVDPATGLIEGGYPQEWAFGVLIDPDEDLVAVGGDPDAVADVLSDDEESLVDSGSFDDVLDGTDDVEYAALTDDPPCGGTRATPEQLEELEQTEIGDLGSPDRSGFFVSGDGDDAVLSGRLEFDDDDAAEADLKARETYLEDGVSVVTSEPVSDLGSADLERDGAVVSMEIDLDKPFVGRRLAEEGDAFFACAPS